MEAGDGRTLDAPVYGTGVLVGGGLAVTTLHTLGAVAPGGIHAASEIEALVPDVGPLSAEIVAWFPELDLVDSRFWGGPLFDSRGQLVGLTVLSLGQPRALGSIALRGLLDEVRQHEADATAARPEP